MDDLAEDFFKCVGYVGNGGTTTISSLTFQPDFVWIKNRDSANHSNLFDSVRGVQKALYSGTTQAESTDSTTLTTFSSNGFAVSSNVGVNENTKKHIAWCFRAGGAPTADNTATSGAMTSNSVSVDGSLQSSYTPSGSPTIYPTRMSVNTKAGFSIVKYVGAGTSNSRTIPHGLSDTPDLIIIKDLDGSNDWITWFQGFGADSYLRLNTSDSKSTVSNAWGGSPNSNTFNVYQSGAHNTSGRDYIAYCWHSVEGYSAFGSYTGNGSADGPFVYTGFKVAWLMARRTSTADWVIFDNARNSFNPINGEIYANSSQGEDTSDNDVDFLSNGFKIRRAATNFNDNGTNHIYMAFAEMPFKYANAR